MPDARQQAILDASKRAREQMRALDAWHLAHLEELFRELIETLQDEARLLALQGRVLPEHLPALLAEADAALARLTAERNALLSAGLNAAADAGATVFTVEAASLGITVQRLAEDAVRFVTQFEAADGLQLSERLWRLNTHTRQTVTEILQRTVLAGDDTTRGALALLDANLEQGLLRAVNNPYEVARRLMRTELNRAHGEAYRAGLRISPDVAGERFMLSPSHPRPDQCDFHAAANLHGLGAGVYPVGASPWPAHPNTLSFLVVVFTDEVSEADQAGQSDGADWLRAQPFERLAEIFNSEKKARAFLAGQIGPGDLTTPARDLGL